MKRLTKYLLLYATTITIVLLVQVEAMSNSDQNFQDSSTGKKLTSFSQDESTDEVNRTSSLPRLQSSSSKKKKSSSLSNSTRSNEATSRVNQQRFPISKSVDPFEIAQQQARLMANFNNTPPLFVTSSRDFFIDVVRYSLGMKLTTMKAVDIDGDPLEYSLQPANLHDASSFFSIDPTSGELRLDSKQFIFYPDHLPLGHSGKQMKIKEGSSAKVSETSNDTLSSEEEVEGEEEDDNDSQYGEDLELVNRNLYFLNVAVNDGRYTSVIELQIHVINSTAFAALQALGGSNPVQLTPEGSRKSDEMERIILRKNNEHLNQIYGIQSLNSTSSPAIVWPNYINPSLTKPTESESSSVQFERRATATSVNQSSEQNKTPVVDVAGQFTPSSGKDPPANERSSLENPPLIPQPMIVSLVVVCSCLMIALVLLLFIIPISVKRLRRRLKHVELQHEHLSQRNSTGSSTVCSSSTGSMNTHNHVPSLSQFTIGSDGSACLQRDGLSICRQSSLDSSTNVIATPLQNPIFNLNAPSNRANNGSIVNPMYLQQQQQQQPLHHHFITNQNLESNRVFQSNTYHLADKSQACDNLYYPLDDDPLDDFYSTINTESTALGLSGFNQQQQPTTTLVESLVNQLDDPTFLAHSTPQQVFQRQTESPRSDSSSNSIRSLARFLSLPNRHPNLMDQKQEDGIQANKNKDEKESHLLASNNLDNSNFRQQSSKTIARGSQINKEQACLNRTWEIERHKLKVLGILDTGQFGLVFRCNLTIDNKRETIVAVKTLKSNAPINGRDREDLLAEVEIMKLVCYHPNVVKILHCCTTNSLPNQLEPRAIIQPIYLVMEYVELGKLQSYLEKSRVNHHYATNMYNNTSSDHLTSRDLIKFIYHVAKGMEYISSQFIVHRDLASRNILVSSQRICKIGDFGMARHMESSSGIYERQSPNAKVPVRWMAPEVLLNNIFTVKSDVFSFGILMWEIVTLGSTPYRHLMAEQVIERVARFGERPSKPEYCHSQLYKIMSKCWSHEPEERPTFSSLVKQLDELLLSANDYIELDQYPDHDYYNIPKTAAPNELL